MPSPLTTSGTYSYSSSVISLVTAALQICQVIGDDDTPTGSQLTSGMDAFAAMTKGWQGSGIHVWCEEECILFLQKGQVQYEIGPSSTDHACLFQQFTQGALSVAAAAGAGTVTVASATGMASGDRFGIQLDAGTNFWTTINGAPSGNVVTLANNLPSAASVGAIVFDYATPLARPLKVMGGRRYNYSSQLDTPINMWARLEYAAQPNKYSPGVITAFFYDPQTGQGAYTGATSLMNAWPSPADYTFGMRFTAQRPIQDISSLANLPDFPVEWNAALKWNLSLELVPQFGVPAEQAAIIERQAAKWFGMASMWDRESESIRFGVAMQPGYRRG